MTAIAAATERGSMLALAAQSMTPTNAALLRALHRRRVPARLVSLEQTRRLDHSAAAVLVRLDTRPTLDGTQPGFFALRALESDGVPVLNRSTALFACHDKLATALRLARAGVPHPATALVDGDGPLPALAGSVVVKPRFGSGGVDLAVCRDREELAWHLRSISGKPWFVRHGALVQQLVETGGRDLHLVVAGDRVIGAVERRARPGRWSTSGGVVSPINPSAEVREVAVEAARAVGAFLAGVDVLPDPSGPLVLELDAAVEFSTAYSLGTSDVFDLAAARLASATGLGGR
jgi:RimK family alpha-L-glutamate ligase